MTQGQKSFVKGAAILAVAGLIVKIIGAFFRIPLANIIGTEGMGYYQMAYPFYSLLAAVATAGLPTAISKMVSERAARGDNMGAYSVFRIARRVLVIFGVAAAAVMFFCAQPIAALQQSSPAVYPLMAMSPALFFVSILSAYRGYFQGMQRMTPTAVSQLVEQMGKLVLGLMLAYLLATMTGRPELGAMGALVGVSISEAVALLYFAVFYQKRKKTMLVRMDDIDQRRAFQGFRPIFRQLLVIAVPVTIGACMMPIISAIDSVIVSRVLQSIGYTQKAATSLYGVLTGYVNPLINMPAVLSTALSMSLVPAIAQACAKGSQKEVSGKASLGMKLAMMVGLPAATGFILLAQPIIRLLYHNVTGAELGTATLLLQMLSFAVLFLTLVQTLTGMLQGAGKVMLPVYSLIVGAAAKVVTSVLLIRMPEINIYGAAVGTILCYVVAAVMDVIFAVRHLHFRLDGKGHFLKPLLATAAMAVCAGLTYRAVGGFSNTAGVLAAIVVGIAVYAVVLAAAKGLDQEELELVPGGSRLEALMYKLKIWRREK